MGGREGGRRKGGTDEGREEKKGGRGERGLRKKSIEGGRRKGRRKRWRDEGETCLGDVDGK